MPKVQSAELKVRWDSQCHGRSSYEFFATEPKRARSALASLNSGSIWFRGSHPLSVINSSQYRVSLASPRQILILFLKSALLLALFASR